MLFSLYAHHQEPRPCIRLRWFNIKELANTYNLRTWHKSFIIPSIFWPSYMMHDCIVCMYDVWLYNGHEYDVIYDCTVDMLTISNENIRSMMSPHVANFFEANFFFKLINFNFYWNTPEWMHFGYTNTNPSFLWYNAITGLFVCVQVCEPVKKLPQCKLFSEVSYTMIFYPDNVTQLVAHCVCPKNAVTYIVHKDPYRTSKGYGYFYSFACSPLEVRLSPLLLSYLQRDLV